MTLPASGSISLSQVNTELSRASGANINMNDAAVRALFGKASGAISMSDGHGKSSSVFNITFPENHLAYFFTVSTNGLISADDGYGNIATYNYMYPLGSFSGLYEIQLSCTAGNFLSSPWGSLYPGKTTTWAALNGDCMFGAGSAYSPVSGVLRIRRKSDGVTVSRTFQCS